jgi:hypothetical protein
MVLVLQPLNTSAASPAAASAPASASASASTSVPTKALTGLNPIARNVAISRRLSATEE